MWSQTSRLTTTLAAGGTVVGKLDILVDGDVAMTLDSTDPDFTDLGGPVDGRVDVQRATVRRTASLSLLDLDRASFTVGDALDLLVPLRAEVRPWRGAIYSDVTTETYPNDRELLPLGTLVVVDVNTDRWPLVQISASDRMWYLSQLKFVTAYQPLTGTPTMTAVQDVIQSRFPASRLAMNLPTTTATISAVVYDKGQDPAEAAMDLAAAAGQVLYVDPMGTFVAHPEPDPNADPVVASYVEGPGSMLLTAARARSGGNTVNAVVVTSTAPDLAVPVSGYAQDDDPTSATYVGSLGVIPEFVDSALPRTSAQADLIARTKLRADAGLSDAVTLTSLVQPGLESGDVIYLSAPSRGLDATLIVDSFGVPLRASESQTVNCRARVSTS